MQDCVGLLDAAASGVFFFFEFYHFLTEHLGEVFCFRLEIADSDGSMRTGTNKKKRRAKNHRKTIRLRRVMSISSFHKNFGLSAHYYYS